MRTSSFVLACALAIGGFSALAEQSPAQRVVLPQDLVWKPAPSAFPPGSEAVVLYGNPATEGPFIVRIRAPKGFRVPLHTHPAPEILTVLSGAVSYGVGPDAKTSHIPAGGLSFMPAGVEHSVIIEEDAVVQINAMGPWRIDYVDPKHDPRKKGK
jgi:quercetin dioxygenase-like cupin family protein